MTATALLLLLAAPGPDEILARADAVRNPADSYVMSVRVTTSERPEEPSLFEVSIKDNDKTLVRTLEPTRDRGRNLLMLGEQMWVYVPSIARPVRVSLAQKLTGDAANGDISRMRWSGDYAPRLDTEDTDSWTLLLTAIRPNLTYERLRVQVDKATGRPRRAEFLTAAARLLKTAEYGGYRSIAGAVRPTEIRITDGIRKDRQSRIDIVSMQARPLPGSLFHAQSLK
jgi:outer membrane lipoprotein-sorting protein